MAITDPIRRVLRLKQANPKRQAESDPRVPPGQYLTDKFPVLTYGFLPVVELDKWRLEVFGLVRHPFELTWEQFLELPAVTIRRDIHCVTRWSKLDTTWEGVPFAEIVRRAEPLPEAQFVMQHAHGRYSTNLPLGEMLADDAILAYRYDGKPLAAEHGGPMRMVVPKLYFWKSAKWLNGIEFMARDRPGFWERYGYHNHGDPWTEERFG